MVQQCKGLTLKGKKCQRKILVGEYCYLHHKKKEICVSDHIHHQVDVNTDECCVCYEGTVNILECNHYLCLGCVNQMKTDTCPLCRTELRGKHITKQILDEIELRKNPPSDDVNIPIDSISQQELLEELINTILSQNTTRYDSTLINIILDSF